MQYPQPNPPYSANPASSIQRPAHGGLSALVLSFFFSGTLYRDVARKWRGIAFWYLVLLMLLTSIPLSIKLHLGFAGFVKTDFAGMASTFPSITISNGQASIAESEPYLWKDRKSSQTILYVDTTGAFDLPEGQNALMKLSRTQLSVRKSASQTQVYQLSAFPNFYIDKTKLSGWVDSASHWVGPVVLATLFVLGIIGRLIQMLVYGLFGLIFCSMFNTRLSYGALLRLSAIAITPAVIIATALDMAGADFPFSGWAFFALEMVYLGFAVKANAVDQSHPPGGFPMTAYPPGYGASPAFPQAPAYGMPAPAPYPPMPLPPAHDPHLPPPPPPVR